MNPKDFLLNHVFWGDKYSEEEVKRMFDEWNLKVTKGNVEVVGDLIMKGKVGAIFEGAMEFGPRALGHRSIVGDPRNKDVKDKINRIKKRQWWRPVAPALLDSAGDKWFNQYEYSPFMTRSFTFIGDEQEYSAIIHKNNTARLQSVRKNVGYIYELLSYFNDKTSVPMLCNTSFNVKDPIVRTPSDAVKTFFSSEMDFLYCQGWLIVK